MSKSEVLNALMASLGPSRIRTDDASLTLLACDAMHPSRLPAGAESAQPLCVVSPQSTAEVQAAVRLANAHRVPVIPLGGGSGLMGGAASVTPGVVLDLCRLAEGAYSSCGPHGGRRRRRNDCGVECGGQALRPDVRARPVDGFGGHGRRHDRHQQPRLPRRQVRRHGRSGPGAGSGPARRRDRHHARGGESLHRSGPASPCSSAPRAVSGWSRAPSLRLFPIPQARLLEGWAFDDFAAGFEAINALLQAGIRPGLLEYGDDDPSADCDPLAALYVSYEGPEAVARAEAQVGREVCLQSGGQMLDPSEVQHFWDQRHASGDAYARARRAGERRSRPEIDYVHVALPPSAVLAYRRAGLKLLASQGFHVHQTGLWAHAGLFSLVYGGGRASAMAEAHAQLLELAQDAGGAMEYCHGVGLRLAPLMRREHGGGLLVLRRIKRAMDPNDIMNPGKLGL